jgi:LPS-assembly protein
LSLSAAILAILFVTGCLFAAPPQAGVTAEITPRINIPGPNDVLVMAVQQESEGSVRRLKGMAQIETAEILLRADFIEYDELTGDAVAEGNVKSQSYESGEVLEAKRVEYNLREETGKFYEVVGRTSGKVDPRPGLLLTNNEFLFRGDWAEKLKDRYVLYKGVLTNCKLPKPIWTLKGPKFDIIPGDRAIIHKSRFRVRGVPLFYAPVFYKSLKQRPRKSGFLTPNVGNSSRRGFMLGGGYYWAINRSYDAAYRAQ